jgi:hypothetical protein
VFIHSRLSEQFSGSQAAFGISFRVTGGYRKAGPSYLKRVTEEGFSQLVKDAIEVSRTFFQDFFFPKRQPSIVKTISAHTKSAVLILRTFKKY